MLPFSILVLDLSCLFFLFGYWLLLLSVGLGPAQCRACDEHVIQLPSELSGYVTCETGLNVL